MNAKAIGAIVEKEKAETRATGALIDLIGAPTKPFDDVVAEGLGPQIAEGIRGTDAKNATITPKANDRPLVRRQIHPPRPWPIAISRSLGPHGCIVDRFDQHLGRAASP